MTNSLIVLLVFVLPPCLVTGDNCPSGKDTLLTYNAGLTPTVVGFEERRHRIPGAVAAEASNVDFMCFQELWYEEDVRRVLEALDDKFPYHYSYLHRGISDLSGHRRRRHTDEPPCGKWNMLKLSGCLALNCFNADDRNLCMTKNCGSYLYDNSKDCLACISVSSSSFTDVLNQCVFSWWGSNNRFNSPGLVVASRRPMTAQYVSFNPTTKVLLERGYIKAQVENGPHIVCTHLSSVFGFYYEAKLPYSSYEEQQRAEIGVLKDRFSGSAHVLLGDLNTGPKRQGSGEANLTGEVPAAYGMMVSAVGYTNPYLENDGRCTYCSKDNQVLVQSGANYGNLLIDHILPKSLVSDSSSAQRLFDDPVYGPLSDHYGVRVDVCRRSA